ncbi:hypothetical protein IE077_002062, partial [Cardiosporidium cionae]
PLVSVLETLEVQRVEAYKCLYDSFDISSTNEMDDSSAINKIDKISMNAEGDRNCGYSSRSSSLEFTELFNFFACEEITLFVGLITATIQHVCLPRLRLLCFSLLRSLSRFATNDCLLEYILPYAYTSLSDQIASVRASALDCIAHALTFIKAIPSEDTKIFT